MPDQDDPKPFDGGPDRRRRRARRVLFPALLALAGLAAYSNSFRAPFIFDDWGSVTANQSIRHLATAFRPDHGLAQTVEGRPVLNLSLALNYALSGDRVWSYHALNLAIHIMAGLALFGIARRTLASDSVAFCIALLWTVHPLQTESVTYVAQRAESLMGLFFLLALYCFIRSSRVREPAAPAADGLVSRREGTIWGALSVACCLLGMGTKETMVSAPLLIALYDCVFVSGSLAKAWRAHRGLWIALASCLVVLAALVASTGGNRSGTIGLGVGVSPFAYLLTQPAALTTYLKLSVLPFPLVFEYGTFWARPDGALALQSLAVAGLLALTAAALRRSPKLGFLGAWFFIILAPTSLVPGAVQMIVEHRMYLPLAAVVALVVLTLHRVLGRRGTPVCLALAAVFGWLTWQRNETYGSEQSLWRDTAAKRPYNERAHFGLANALEASGNGAGAIAEYEAALRIKPNYTEAHYNLGIALFQEGRPADAIAHFERAIQLAPRRAEAHYVLGIALEKSPGRRDRAIEEYRTAIGIRPDYADARNNLGNALNAEGRCAEAIPHLLEALRLDPDMPQAHYNLGNALNAEGRASDAIAQYREALRLEPDYADAHVNLGAALFAQGRADEALSQYREALRLRPDFAAAHYNLGVALAGEGQTAGAMAQYRETLRLEPDYAEAHNNLGIALSRSNRAAEAADEFEAALRLNPDDAEAHNNLGMALSKQGRLAGAIDEFEKALRLEPGSALFHFNLAIALLRTPGRVGDAVAQLREVLRLHPGDELARSILNQIGVPGP